MGREFSGIFNNRAFSGLIGTIPEGQEPGGFD
jgi:hypothetical protein